MLFFGYAGKIIKINLSDGCLTKESLDESMALKYLGGSGFGTKFLWNLTDKKTEPFNEDNPLIISVGPLTGTGFQGANRTSIISKSPLTGVYGDSSAGGFFGPELKYAGYDCILIQGKSKKPVYLYIGNNEIKLYDAREIWNKGVFETEKFLKKKHPHSRVASIGIGGENRVRFASIMFGLHRAAGRTGMGAVMGSKKLKAIVVRGHGEVKVKYPDKVGNILKKINSRLLNNPFSETITRYGTTILVELMNEIGRFPTLNFQSGVFSRVNLIDGDRIIKEFKMKDRACFGCRYGCKNYINYLWNSKKVFSDHPEYETISSFGGRVGNSDLKTIFYLNCLCDDFGLDTISTGGVIAFCMELEQRGLLDRSLTGGKVFKWGNQDLLIEIVKDIAHRKNFGDKMAEGTLKLSRLLGKETEKYAMHVKGLDIPAQDGRAQKSMGLAHATSTRGADHLKASAFLDEVGFESAISERFGIRYLPEMADRLSPKYKAKMVKECEDFSSIADSLTVCKTSGYLYPPIYYFNDVVEMLNSVTGMNISESELRRIGERIFNLQRAYNIREGLTSADDNLPERFTKEKAPDGIPKGHVVELKEMLKEYYQERGWDEISGYIKKQKLKELNLDFVKSEI